ncbi:energy-coupling factor transporter transmembrane component T family protein [Fructilactobacillus carniphilus]|uniref:Energy-coupling factor transporter transmembrane protein EcfT n=1 Tax=Fructilactobacillus carniphilus TaxID=2940297 RepID=A0ABY5C0I3_9LACO|nr:energy-coupling factor transporter transmembrane component T [Fructilactobacillus carniphilus]USS90790.1 energy-coupling factor transporter transmembrane protein EcfT [Fructilactobacillus carniphilus]
MNHMVFGNYLPGHSLLHRLHPTGKIIGLVSLITWTLLANNWANYAVLTVVILALVKMAQVPFGMLFSSLRPFVWLIAFTVLIQLGFGHGGTTYWHWGPLNVTSVGVTTAGLIFVRFLLIIVVAMLLTVTTSPNAIAKGVETFLTPLKKLGVPVAMIGIMLSIALRFIPTLLSEMQTIMNAQRSRGVVFNGGSLWQRVKNVLSLIIPLLVSAFRHADNLADALGASGYDASQPRSSYYQYQWHLLDTLALVGVFLIGVLVVGLRGV